MIDSSRRPGHPESLSDAEAARRLRTHGPNELNPSERHTWLTTVWDVVRQPMLLLLIAAAAVYVSLGDRIEAILLIASIAVVIGIELYQHIQTEHALRALRDLSSPRALVIRDGRTRRIPGREVVVDDVIVLEEGDRVPADALVLESTNLLVDESLLTGESLPVGKERTHGESNADLHSTRVFSGTLVAAGQGIAHVVATGPRTELGKIGTSLESVEVQRTPLQREVDRVAGLLGRAALVVCALISLAYGVARSSWVEGLLAGLSAAMSMIPEEFSIVLAAFLALGAARLAKDAVLTRRVAAIEALGATTVLCTDKTGTLTVNQMTVGVIETEEVREDITGEVAQLSVTARDALRCAALASRPTPVDPMDRAIRSLSARALPALEPSLGLDRFVREYSLRSSLAVMVNVWAPETGDHYSTAAKGSPEAILDLCHIDGPRRHAIERRVEALAGQGYRVLGSAGGTWPASRALPEHRQDLELQFLGLLAFADPVRTEVPAAIAECYAAGIRVIMITGDHRHTAEHIASQVGLRSPGVSLTGSEMERMSEAELQERIQTTNIFVRVSPDQKLQIVNALLAGGDIVAMTGDGVNDAPALKAAHIGIAMGGRGTDVAREAAPLVLLDDNFASIVRGVRGGRRIFDNLSKSMAFLLSVHVPIAGLTLVPAVLGWPLILLPSHIVLLEFVVDPACSLVFEREPEEPNVMHRPPRDPSTPLFTRDFVGLTVLQGAVVFISSLAVHILAVTAGGHEVGYARTLTFATLIVGLLGLILTNRSFSEPIVRSLVRRNRMLWGMLGAAPLILLVLLVQPNAREVFHFSEVSYLDLMLSVGAGLLAWFVLDLTEQAGLFKTRPGRA